MIKGVLKNGFKFAIEKERLENYELIETLSELDDNPLMLPKAVNLLLGQEQSKRLKDCVRDEKGFVPTEKLTSCIFEIFQTKQLKN